MTLPFMAYAASVGLALVLTGAVLERAAVAWRWPRRWGWAALLVVGAVLLIATPWRSALGTAAWARLAQACRRL